VEATMSEATAQFLDAAADDLQRQMSVAGTVEGVSAATTPVGMTLRATIQVAQRRIEVIGRGDSLLTAYADLRLRVAEPMLATAYRAVLEG
jgi:hypothetical protein